MEEKKEMTELEKEEQSKKTMEEIETCKKEYLYDDDIEIIDGVEVCKLGY